MARPKGSKNLPKAKTEDSDLLRDAEEEKKVVAEEEVKEKILLGQHPITGLPVYK